jgi:hypothetical protein
MDSSNVSTFGGEPVETRSFNSVIGEGKGIFFIILQNIIKYYKILLNIRGYKIFGVFGDIGIFTEFFI